MNKDIRCLSCRYVVACWFNSSGTADMNYRQCGKCRLGWAVARDGSTIRFIVLSDGAFRWKEIPGTCLLVFDSESIV